MPIKLALIFLFFSAVLYGQNAEIDRLVDGELKMTFPSIYFKHNSVDYAAMPYSVDSCFKYIAANIKNLNSYPIWRDSVETDQLTNVRVKKLKADLNKYIPSNKIYFHNEGKAQKVSRLTISKTSDPLQIQYLLSLNSVLDVSGVMNSNKKKYKNHIERPLLSCWDCWKNGFHLQTRRKLHKMAKRNKKNSRD